MKEVAAEFGVAKAKIRSARRGSDRVVIARDEVCRRLHDEYGFSFRALSEYFRKRAQRGLVDAVMRGRARLEAAKAAA